MYEEEIKEAEGKVEAGENMVAIKEVEEKEKAVDGDREAAVEEGREEREEEEKELDLVGEGMEVDLMDKMEVAVALKVNMEEENIFLLTSHVHD